MPAVIIFKNGIRKLYQGLIGRGRANANALALVTQSRNLAKLASAMAPHKRNL